MKQRMKLRTAQIFCCCLLLIVCLVSCGKTENEMNGGDTKKPQEGAEENTAEEDTEEKELADLEDPSVDQNAGSPNINEEPEVMTNHENTDFVLVKDYIPNLYVDLRYATNNNFTGQIIYDFDSAYLRYGTVKKLAMAAEELGQNGYALKIWDAFRPVSAQFVLWEVYPDNTYVANPNQGYSSHSRGNTIDMTMVTADGDYVEMPTDFDSFSLKADRDYSDCTEEAAKNAVYLEQTMEKYGFKPYSGEWWHFSDVDEYEVESEFEPAANEPLQ